VEIITLLKTLKPVNKPLINEYRVNSINWNINVVLFLF